MKKELKLTPALSAEALLGKSKTFIARALAAKNRGDLDEYQLWASLALELLGKSALASVHPCLIADPLHYPSLFAAAGMPVEPDVKTITAKTLFERLTHVSIRFDGKTKDYCQGLSAKRNSELHSGELPFEGVVPSSWEGRYWHTVEIILEARGETLEQWIGANQAKAPKELLATFAEALKAAVAVRVETSAEAFAKMAKKDREQAHASADKLSPQDVRRNFDLMPDAVWETRCPACESKAFLAGEKYFEEASTEQGDEYSEEEYVVVTYGAEEFHCPSCKLHLDRREQIETAGLEVEHNVEETREREYEPDYGND